MPHGVSKWIRKKIAEKKGKSPMPVLPETRPRPITPSESCPETFITPNGIFFERLPAEIRRQILLTAFGDRTVHMDLFYDHPMLPRSHDSSSSGKQVSTHCALNVSRSGRDREVLNLDSAAAKQWIWRSSVCHRNHPECRRKPPGYRVQPCDDRCRFGDVSNEFFCGYYPGEWPHKCFIGAMGWLLSCRQAYLEGLEILYSTNTIHTSSKDLVMHLPQLLPAERIASIKSIEILWEFVPFPRQDRADEVPTLTDLESFYSFLEIVPRTFANTKNIYISLQGQLKPLWSYFPVYGEEWYKFTEQMIMRPVDAMIRKLEPQMRQVSVAIPSSLYAVRRNKARACGTLVEQTYLGGQLERHWRHLDNTSSRLGYWVQLGQRDWIPSAPVLKKNAIPGSSIDEEDEILYSWKDRNVWPM